VSAIDRPGLLYALAHCLSGRQVQVDSARITTLGERVEDTFVVRGAVFADDRATLALETDLLGLLQEPGVALA
jgi:[protein-PII] uridylyltransferase